MTELVELLVRGMLIGIGGAAAMDVWGLAARRAFGIQGLDYALLGRWIGHFFRGRFVHVRIAVADPIPGERPLGDRSLLDRRGIRHPARGHRWPWVGQRTDHRPSLHRRVRNDRGALVRDAARDGCRDRLRRSGFATLPATRRTASAWGRRPFSSLRDGRDVSTTTAVPAMCACPAGLPRPKPCSDQPVLRGFSTMYCRARSQAGARLAVTAGKHPFEPPPNVGDCNARGRPALPKVIIRRYEVTRSRASATCHRA